MSIQAEKRGKKAKKPSKAVIVEQMIEEFEKKLKLPDVKVTVGDYIRLVQFHGELEAEEPKEIKVTWVEPIEKEPVIET